MSRNTGLQAVSRGTGLQAVSRGTGLQAVNRGYPCTPVPLFIIPPVLQVHGKSTGLQGNRSKGKGVMMIRGVGRTKKRATSGRVQVASRGNGAWGG